VSRRALRKMRMDVRSTTRRMSPDSKRANRRTATPRRMTQMVLRPQLRPAVIPSVPRREPRPDALERSRGNEFDRNRQTLEFATERENAETVVEIQPYILRISGSPQCEDLPPEFYCHETGKNPPKDRGDLSPLGERLRVRPAIALLGFNEVLL